MPIRVRRTTEVSAVNEETPNDATLVSIQSTGGIIGMLQSIVDFEAWLVKTCTIDVVQTYRQRDFENPNVDDLSHDVWIAAMKRCHVIYFHYSRTGVDRARAYIFTTAYNKHCKSFRRRPTTGEDVASLSAPPDDLGEESTLDRFCREEALCVEGLPSHHQIVYIDYRINKSEYPWLGRDLTSNEAAVVAGMNPGTKRANLHHARYAVLKCLHAKGVIDTETYNRLMGYDPL